MSEINWNSLERRLKQESETKLAKKEVQNGKVYIKVFLNDDNKIEPKDAYNGYLYGKYYQDKSVSIIFVYENGEHWELMNK